jgi:hypothetical protein
MGRTGPIWAAPVAMLLLAGCASERVDSTTTVEVEETTITSVAPTSTASSVSTTLDSSTTVTTVPPTTVTTVPATTAEPEDVAFSPGWTVPFTMTAPSTWARHEASSGETLVIDAGLGRFVLFTLDGPDTVEGWIERLQAAEPIDVGEPTAMEVGGATGQAVEVRLGPEATDTGCFSMGPCWNVTGGDFGWVVLEDTPNRFWILDVDGETVAILTEATERGFESWVAEVVSVLSTITWEG